MREAIIGRLAIFILVEQLNRFKTRLGAVFRPLHTNEEKLRMEIRETGRDNGSARAVRVIDQVGRHRSALYADRMTHASCAIHEQGDLKREGRRA